MLLKLLKWLLILAILGGIALVGYAYLGPIFGADFSPQQQEIRQEVILENG